ncbi:MAG: trypsin-like peptidase domain-containing protein [Candidatus Scalindua sediminis]|nr:trypsin-like peptidase domain-containing protein [Candidatus Scalindua sediminis]
MLKRVLCVLSILIIYIFINNIYGQTIDDLSKTVVFLQNESQAFEMKSGKKIEVWYKDPLTKNLEPKKIKKTGTGFLIKHNGRDYVVTAKHVAKFLDNTSEILLNVLKDNSISISFDILKKSPIINGAKWFYHPIADIALHPIAYPMKVDQLAIRTIDIPKDEIKIKLLSNVYILGFPLGLGVHESISPIAKKTQIASNITTIEHPNISPELKFYLLDQALAQGYSGSPVFCAEELSSGIFAGKHPIPAGEKITLTGILSGGLSDATGGKISLVVPISYVWEILNSNEFLKYEIQLPKQKK